MTYYEETIVRTENRGLKVHETNLEGYDGLIMDETIAIRGDIETEKEKVCVLAEEVGHYETSAGNILDYDNPNNAKQEAKARHYGLSLVVGLERIIEAYMHGCKNIYEAAEYLDVTEEYLRKALERYHSKYGKDCLVDGYWIVFEPSLMVYEV